MSVAALEHGPGFGAEQRAQVAAALDARRRFGSYVHVLTSLAVTTAPVFHAYDGGRHGREDDLEPNERGETRRAWVSRVGCGRVSYRSSWREVDGEVVEGSHMSESPGTLVYVGHAIRFARPCHRCWPEETS